MGLRFLTTLAALRDMLRHFSRFRHPRRRSRHRPPMCDVSLIRASRLTIFAFALACVVASVPSAPRLEAQVAVATADINVRSSASTAGAIVTRLRAGDSVSLEQPGSRHGYYHVREPDGSIGWVYGRYLRVRPVPEALSLASHGATNGTPGTYATVGCGDHLWTHVYHPSRLHILDSCVTVTGTVVDASGGRRSDGARHEADGDTHSWLRVDPQFRNMLDSGNRQDEGGNLVFEIVCHYRVTQADAKSACETDRDRIPLPPIGSHVAVTGTYVQDQNHGRWNEIHPVSRIEIVR